MALAFVILSSRFVMEVIMDNEDKTVWEEFPPSKYGCTLSRYTLCLATDAEFYERYPIEEERIAKALEASKWVYQFPEVSML